MILLTSEDDSVALKDFEFVHLGLSQLDDGVVVLWRILSLELVGGLLLLKNCRRVIFSITTITKQC